MSDMQGKPLPGHLCKCGLIPNVPQGAGAKMRHEEHRRSTDSVGWSAWQKTSDSVGWSAWQKISDSVGWSWGDDEW